MSSCIQNKPLKPLSRSVSIIGVGATPFMRVVRDPELDGLGEGELFGTAAIAAMKDAGVTPKDVEYYFQAQALPMVQSGYITPNAQVGNWFGMKGKASSHHSEACCTGYIALEQGVMAVASGAYDIVLTGACDMSFSKFVPGKPSYFREILTNEIFATQCLPALYDKSYATPSLGANPMASDGWMEEYRLENNMTPEQIDDILCNVAYNSRRAASLNPRALYYQQDYEKLAAEAGMSVTEYLHSDNNFMLSYLLRRDFFEARADGAAAVVVCPTEMAYQYTDHPIEVLGTGHATLDGFTGSLEKYGTEAAYNQIKELTGLGGKDMDLFLTNDFFMSSQLLSAELCEYLPKNEGWKYFEDGTTAFDGDKPVNTSGGRCHYGHAHGTSGLADVFEAVQQLRGNMGPTQIKGDPKYAMLRGFGGGQNFTCTILEKK